MTDRALTIAGLRELADYLEARPDVPTPYVGEIHAFPGEDVLLGDVARAMGGFEKDHDGTYLTSKEAQVARSPGGNRRCSTTGELKRNCKCRPCLGRRSKYKGQRKQRDARKDIEKVFGPAGRYSSQTGNEELWRTRVRVEVKSGVMAKTVDTFYRNTKSQSDQAKAIGDTRPYMAVAMPDGVPYGYAVVRLDHLEAVVSAARGG